MAKLARHRRLRAVVEAQLADYWSPEEISAWLARAYPNDPEMRVSHETIYMSLFVQGRGALRQELHACLRSGRALRRPKARTKGGFGQGQITNPALGNYCPPSYYIDGNYFPLPPNQTLTLPLVPGEILAIEVYSNLFSAPQQYQRRDSGCGIILIWTKRGVPNPPK